MDFSPISNTGWSSPYGYGTSIGRQTPDIKFPGQKDNSETPDIKLPGQRKDSETPDIKLPGQKDDSDKAREKRTGLKDPTQECETCKNRKYKDGSDEMVSFKSAAHISPEASASTVRAHEQEHVTNAYSKAATGNGKVIHATVSLQTAICPECGRSYVSGGVTNTQIKYYNEENPYQKDLKTSDGIKYKGMNADYAV